MNLQSAIDILRQHNKWRCCDDGSVPESDPKLLGQAIDLLTLVGPELISLAFVVSKDESQSKFRRKRALALTEGEI